MNGRPTRTTRTDTPFPYPTLFRSAVPRPRSRAAGRRDPGAGDRPSQVVDGAEDLGRLGHADEQGPGGDRGPPPVRPARRAHRRAGAPAEPEIGRAHV